MSKKAVAKRKATISEGLEGLLYQSLETELGGVEVYRTALKCVQNDDLRSEWVKYLAQTQEHLKRVQDLCVELGLDPDTDTPGRQAVRTVGKALVRAMLLALGDDKPGAAELVAAECVVLAETKDHLNWSLLGEFVRAAPDDSDLGSLADVQAELEAEEDEHLYHTQGWTRELWKQALGLAAELPPPEEEEDVQSELEAVVSREAAKGSRT